MRTPGHVPKLDKKHPSTAPVLGDLEKFHKPHETRAASELGRDVRQRDLQKRRYYDLSWRQRVATPDRDARPLPQAYAAGDLTATNSLTQTFEELHDLRPAVTSCAYPTASQSSALLLRAARRRG